MPRSSSARSTLAALLLIVALAAAACSVGRAGAPVPTWSSPTSVPGSAELASPVASPAPAATPKPAPVGGTTAGGPPNAVRMSPGPTIAPPPSTDPGGAGPGGGGGAPVASGPTHRVATRVVVPGLGIDLPVIRQTTSYPACNVAMYLGSFKQPGQGGVTYLYAHARTGMFLELLERSMVGNGASMIGLTVEVYTGDSRRFVYRIDEVRRHVRDFRYVTRRTGESLWLQTSEGPRGTIPKLQVGASLVSSGSTTYAASHPVPRPVACG